MSSKTPDPTLALDDVICPLFNLAAERAELTRANDELRELRDLAKEADNSASVAEIDEAIAKNEATIAALGNCPPWWIITYARNPH